MTDYGAAFRKSHPRAIDFLETEYTEYEQEITTAAQLAGYRLAGVRLGFAVFTTKPLPAAKKNATAPEAR